MLALGGNLTWQILVAHVTPVVSVVTAKPLLRVDSVLPDNNVKAKKYNLPSNKFVTLSDKPCDNEVGEYGLHHP